MAQQTAIHWLREKLEEAYDKQRNLPATYTFALLNAAEQMEKQQIIAAHTRAYLIGEDTISIDDANERSEEYYNAIYNL